MEITELMKELVHRFEKSTEDYYNGKIEIEKVHSLGKKIGIYPERKAEGKKYTVRIRIPAGTIKKEQLKEIFKAARKYSENEPHLTTRQNIQLTGIKLKNTSHILQDLLNVGITTMGSTGPGPRNITAPPLSGYDTNEVFDTIPHALAATEYLLKDEKNLELPAKFQIGFSHNEKDYGKARISDLGFVAAIENNKKGFRVFGGGGMGALTREGILIRDFIEESEIFIYIEAMKKVLIEQAGIETNIKVRTRHLLNKLGENNFINYFENALKNMDLKESPCFKENEKLEKLSERCEMDLKCALKTNVNGKFALEYKPENGNVNIEKFIKIIEKLETLSYGTVLRIGMDQNLFIIGISEEDIEKNREIFGAELYENAIPRIISCTGNSKCRIGISDSKKMAEKLIDAISEIQNLPDIYISGCPSSCGKHHIGQIGMYGRKRREGEEIIDVYRLFLGGDIHGKTVKFAEEYGEIPEENVLKLLVDISDLFEKNASKDFNEFIAIKNTELAELIKKYESREL